mmetsp:Transcript_9655/g.17560  ORF Transcript_9655/g.17560 Transcript_9655/m.17560 type:complete len:86 (-) Transcript_9655:1027-1284(-)
MLSCVARKLCNCCTTNSSDNRVLYQVQFYQEKKPKWRKTVHLMRWRQWIGAMIFLICVGDNVRSRPRWRQTDESKLVSRGTRRGT